MLSDITCVSITYQQNLLVSDFFKYYLQIFCIFEAKRNAVFSKGVYQIRD